MKIGVVGLGYVGLPLVVAFAEAGHEVVGVDVNARVVAALGEGRSHIEDVSDETLQAISERFHPTPRYADLAKVDAVVVAVPTPLTANREPDLQPLIDTGTALANVLQAGQLVVLESTTYPGTTRERFGPLLEESGPGRGARLPPRLLTRADRPGPHRLHAAQHAQGRRRPDRRVPAPRRRAVRRGLRRGRGGLHAGGRGADQAAREHLPLGEHRARERAGDPLRPDGHRRVGGRRGGGDQAVRLHVVQAGARAWAGTACRSTRSTSPGGRASSTCRPSSSSWPARSTRRMPYFCVERIARALNDQAKPVKGSRMSIVGVSYKPGVGDLRESPALKIVRLLRDAGRRRLLPRRLRAGAARLRAAQRVARGRRLRRDRHRPPGARRGAPGAASRRSSWTSAA